MNYKKQHTSFDRSTSAYSVYLIIHSQIRKELIN